MIDSATQGFRPHYFVWSALKLFIIYMLSYGPVQALYSSQRLEGPMPAKLATLYEPAKWVYENTPIGKPMTVYDGWWARVLKRS